MTPVTENANLLLHDSVASTFEDPSTDAGKIWAELLTTMTNNKGVQQHYWGRRVEDPTQVVWSIDWDDITSHTAFTESPAYAPFISSAKSLFNFDDPTTYLTHVHYDPPHPTAPREAPVTEHMTLLYPLDVDRTHTVEQAVSALHSAILKGGHDAQGVIKAKSAARGWMVEEVDRELDSEGKPTALGKAAGFNVMIGWETVEDHERIRATEEMKTLIGPIKDHIYPFPTRKGWGLAHVAFRKG